MKTFLSILQNLEHASVLIVGDVMLDSYIYGIIDRISPEAPVPILKITHKKEVLGGAGNVLNNVCSLGARGLLISVIGDDQNGQKVEDLLGKMSILFKSKNRPTTTKTRYVCGSQQILRTDVEKIGPLDGKIEDQLISAAIERIDESDCVILSDYKKGVLSSRGCQMIINHAIKRCIPVFVDPKGNDFSIYGNATLIKPNLKELAAVFANEDISGIENSFARKITELYGIKYCLVTKGKQGMALVSANKEIEFKAEKKQVYDVSGAGDTAIATVATSYCSGATIEQACYLSNLAAGIVVSKSGTSTITTEELKMEFGGSPKIVSSSDITKLVENWRKVGYSIGFTNGCFDLLHAGHIQTLNFARNNCDKLIVAINSDLSIKNLKGNQRPIIAQRERVLIMSELQSVDAIVLFDEHTPENLILRIQPDILVKGADYKSGNVVGSQFVQSYGGAVLLAPVIKELSTTNIISKIKATE